MDIAVGHDFWPQRCGAGSFYEQGGDVVKLGSVLRKVLPFDDMGLCGVSTRAALHQLLRCTRKLRTMPYSLRLQSRDGGGVYEDADFQGPARRKRFLA